MATDDRPSSRACQRLEEAWAGLAGDKYLSAEGCDAMYAVQRMEGGVKESGGECQPCEWDRGRWA